VTLFGGAWPTGSNGAQCAREQPAGRRLQHHLSGERTIQIYFVFSPRTSAIHYSSIRRHLIAPQILCRILTFGINAYIVRHVGREVLGIMNVRLLLLESTLLFLSREAINRAALSANAQQGDRCSWAQLINQMWLT